MDPLTMALLMGGASLAGGLLGNKKPAQMSLSPEEQAYGKMMLEKSQGKNLYAPEAYKGMIGQIGGSLNAAIANPNKGSSRNLAARNIVGAASSRAMEQGQQSALLGLKEQQDAMAAYGQYAGMAGDVSRQNQQSMNAYKQKQANLLPNALMAGLGGGLQQSAANQETTRYNESVKAAAAQQAQQNEFIQQQLANQKAYNDVMMAKLSSSPTGGGLFDSSFKNNVAPTFDMFGSNPYGR